ncbi:hypothetical protein TNCV_1676491 [Trichonephila clavipes]|nr:hypothetical protein TNCV_1676491 [Trichonephila clavipes]
MASLPSLLPTSLGAEPYIGTQRGANVAPSLGASESSRTIRTHSAEGHDIFDSGAHYVCCPCRPPIDASVCSGAAHEETGLQRNGTRSSSVTKPDSISEVMTIVFMCGDSVVNA